MGLCDNLLNTNGAVFDYVVVERRFSFVDSNVNQFVQVVKQFVQTLN